MTVKAQPKGTEREPDINMPVGEILRRKRLHYDQTLPQVESVLRIRASQLEAIEEGDIDKLPGRVYAIGFVRAYAEYLGLDGNEIVSLFKNQAVGNRVRPELNFPVAASESKLPNLYILIGSCVLLIIIMAGWIMFNRGDDAVMEGIRTISAAPEVEMIVADVIESEAPDAYLVPDDVTEEIPMTEPLGADTLETIALENHVPLDNIVINITESSWVEIRDQETDKIIVSRVLNPGDSYIVPDDRVLVMDTGNAGGLDISINGKAVPKLGDHSDVVRGIVLQADSLRNRR